MPVQLTIKVEGAQLVRKGLEDLAAEIPKIARKDIYDALAGARRELATPSAKPTYPINWDSARQKTAFFMSDGFGAGIPYARSSTGSVWKSWKILSKGAIGWVLSNGKSFAKYVFGSSKGQSQSNIHKGRVKLFVKVVEKYIKGLPKIIESHIVYYGRARTAGRSPSRAARLTLSRPRPTGYREVQWVSEAVNDWEED